MRTRDSNIPIFLWVTTAILAHLVWGGGVNQVSRFIEERMHIQRFALAVEQLVRMKGQTVEIALLDDTTLPRPKDKEEPAEAPEATPDPTDKKPVPEPPRPQKSPAEREKRPTEKPAPKPEEKKAPEPPKPPEKKPEEAKPPEPLPKIITPNRIAVRQHVEDKDQKDNPNAEFIADEAHKVAEQTQSRVTSTDQNDKDPTPAANHAGAEKAPGDSNETRIAQSEDRAGEMDRAPNEGSSKGAASKSEAKSSNPAASKAESAKVQDPSNAPPGAAAASKQNEPPEAGQKARTALKSQDFAPETANAENGSFAVPGAQPSVTGRKAQRAKKRRLPPVQARGPMDLFGLGAPGTTASGINLNLSPRMAFAAVGQDRLARERKADAERRKSAHRGSWQAVGIERWRSAIENYVASVKPGNQTALNTARVPFASYLNQIHNRLHPIFADSFLSSLDRLSGSDPMNRSGISTSLEIVLTQDEGRIVRMGVTKTSGVTAFDVAALESVQRAQPFGAPPREIVSPDGNVYFHWEFYRDPFYACSTYFARPYMLKVKPKTAPPETPAPSPAPYDPSEPPGSDQQQGRLGALHRALEKRASLR